MRVVALFAFVLVSVLAQDELKFVHVFHRHGSKVPDLLEPLTTPFWSVWGYAGELTDQGILEMESLGKFIRQRYIEEESFLSEDYVQSDVHVRASSYNPRPLQSAAAAMMGLYPGAAVPIYTEDPERDGLVASSLTRTCPSYFIEQPRLYEEFDEFLEENYDELYEILLQLTEYPDMTASQFLANLGDKYESELTHFYAMHPFLRESSETFLPLVQRYYNTPYTREDVDPRGDLFQEMGREILGNLRDASNGEQLKLGWYSSHGIIVAGVRSLLNLDMSPRVDYGEAITLELWQGELGGFYVRAYSLTPVREGLVTRVIYRETPIVLNCPGPDLVCNLVDFLDALNQRTGPEDGCCLRTEAFFTAGCGDFLNPATLEIPDCKRWREVCPQTACDLNQVVDSVTLECVPVVA